VRVKPTRAQLVAVEDKIMVHLPEYLKSDITIPLVCMLKLNFYPQAIFNELNQMQKLSIFKKDQCLRVLDTLIDFLAGQGNDELSNQVIEKMIAQSVV
jgi:hypothetical protein